MRRFSRRSWTSSRNVAERAVPRVAHADPVVLGAAEGLGARGGIGVVAVAGARRRAARRGACSTRSGRRPASGSGRRGREVEASSTASVPVPLSNQRRRRAGASTASQDSRSPNPWRRNTTASWPITITRRLPDVGGQAPHRVHEGAEVRLAVGGQRVQARVHRRVRGLEHAQVRLPRGAQQRRVRAVVELDLVGGQPGGLAQRPAGWTEGTRRRGTAMRGHATGLLSSRCPHRTSHSPAAAPAARSASRSRPRSAPPATATATLPAAQRRAVSPPTRSWTRPAFTITQGAEHVTTWKPAGGPAEGVLRGLRRPRLRRRPGRASSSACGWAPWRAIPGSARSGTRGSSPRRSGRRCEDDDLERHQQGRPR